MSDTPLIILGSSRKKSDTLQFLQTMFKDRPFDLIELLDYTVSPYRYDGEYPTEDGFLKIMEQVQQHELVIFATPVYWYNMSGLLKNFMDRFTDLVNIHKSIGRSLQGKAMFLVTVGTDPELPKGFELPFQNTAAYFGMEYSGHVYYCSDKH